MASTFSVGGLASGMDTNSIIDKLVEIESQPLSQIKTRQSNIKVQVSALADIISKVQALGTAATDLASNGAFAAKVTSTTSTFTATAGSGASPGGYSVQVEQTATAAKWRSDAFASGQTLSAGTLRLTVQGKQYPPAGQSAISITEGETLSSLAFRIKQSGAPVSALVLTDASGNSYLSLTNRDTGTPLDGGDALSLDYTQTGTTGTALDAGTPTVTAARNAKLLVDGVEFERTSNVVGDVIPGVTLQLGSVGAAESLAIDTDATATQARLQTFVDAYNAVNSLIQRQLNVAKDSDRDRSLAGDASVRDVQRKVQRLAATVVPGLSGVRSLADLGLKTARDGSISIDQTTLDRALSTDPSAVNTLFSASSGGIGALVKDLVDKTTRTGDGILTARQDGLNSTITDLDKQAETLQRRIDAYRETLVAQFSAMENIVSQLKSVGSYLTNLDSSSSSSSKS